MFDGQRDKPPKGDLTVIDEQLFNGLLAGERCLPLLGNPLDVGPTRGLGAGVRVLLSILPYNLFRQSSLGFYPLPKVVRCNELAGAQIEENRVLLHLIQNDLDNLFRLVYRAKNMYFRGPFFHSRRNVCAYSMNDSELPVVRQLCRPHAHVDPDSFFEPSVVWREVAFELRPQCRRKFRVSRVLSTIDFVLEFLGQRTENWHVAQNASGKVTRGNRARSYRDIFSIQIRLQVNELFVYPEKMTNLSENRSWGFFEVF